ncbi:MAG: SIR2 family NAD-dependent protein deacylase [Methanobacteriota archaeon]
METELGRAADAIRDRRVAVHTGVGVSTDSGVPDFRGPHGIWTRFDPDEFRIERFRADPRRFWTMRARLMREFALDEARPNAAHQALAGAARSDRLLGIATQNVDGLHAEAGTPPEKVVELHGNAANVRCLPCGRARAYAEVEEAAARDDVRCDACGGTVKPDVVLFGEPLPGPAWTRAERWAREAEAYLAVGTSRSVHPAASLALIAAERGAALVIVNDGPTDLDPAADVRLAGRVADVLPTLLKSAGLLG